MSPEARPEGWDQGYDLSPSDMSHPSLSLSILIWEEGLRELRGDCPSRDPSRSSQPSSQKTSVNATAD